MSGAPVLIVDPRPGPTAALGLWLRVGSAHEPAEAAGITHLIEHLLLRRTHRRGADAIAELIDSLGGAVDAYTTKESCALTAHVPAERFDEAWDLLLDCFFSPRFVPAEVETERSVVDAEFDMVQDSPGEVVAERALEACWGDHPLARPVLGDREVLRTLDAPALERFHHRTFTTDRVVAVVVGPVDERAVESRLARIRRGGGAIPSLRAPEWHPGLTLEHRDGLEQVYVNLVLPALPTGHPDTLTLGVLHQLLGAGNSSRLFRELRDRRGLVYDVSSAVFAGSVAGVLEIVFSAPSRNLAACWDGVSAILEDIARGGVGDREVELATQALRAGVVLDSEGSDALLEAHAGEFLGYGRRYEMERLLQELDAVTPGRVRSLARRLVRPEAIGGAVCGPAGTTVLPAWLPERAA